MPRPIAIASQAFLVLVLSSSLAAQATWRLAPGSQPAGRSGHAAAYDEARQRLVLFGGTGEGVLGDTWEWDGTTWQRRFPAHTPSPRSGASMAYDARRGVTVLFGGLLSQTVYGDTWEWDGTDWTEVTTATAPSPRYGQSLTWDPVRQRMVLFGGNTSFAGDQSDETWEYDGSNWILRQPATHPGARDGQGAAYDEVRQRLVLYGGAGTNVTPGELWEWDGTNWQQRMPANPPPARAAALAYDRTIQRIVLYGGSRQSGPLQDTWLYDGNAWQQIASASKLGPRQEHAMVYDPALGEVLVVGGTTSQLFVRTSSIGAFDGRQWQMLSQGTLPTLFDGVVFDDATRRPLAFGGRTGILATSDDTWTFDGSQWVLAAPAQKPPPRNMHVLVRDRARGRVVLFGGQSAAVVNDTWEWDGSTWTQRMPAHAPAPRLGAAATYDESRERVVLYGGGPSSFSSPYADTWEWDGTDWTQVVTATSPGPRWAAALAYDARRQVVVMFGGGKGFLGNNPTAETWEYDGVDWTQRKPVHTPPPQIRASMVFDPVRDRVVLVNGANGGAMSQSWEWDGSDWQSIAGAVPAYGHLIFDEANARTIAFVDGLESWEYRTDSPPSLQAFGQGCPGAFGVPRITAAPLSYPVLGRGMTLQVGAVHPATPVFLLVGTSTSMALGQPLPLDLTGAGMPGCTLLQSSEAVTWSLADASGTATFGLAVPNAAPLLGLAVYAQGFLPDPTANPLGWIATGGLGATVGW